MNSSKICYHENMFEASVVFIFIFHSEENVIDNTLTTLMTYCAYQYANITPIRRELCFFCPYNWLNLRLFPNFITWNVKKNSFCIVAYKSCFHIFDRRWPYDFKVGQTIFNQFQNGKQTEFNVLKFYYIINGSSIIKQYHCYQLSSIPFSNLK